LHTIKHINQRLRENGVWGVSGSAASGVWGVFAISGGRRGIHGLPMDPIGRGLYIYKRSHTGLLLYVPVGPA